MSAYNEINRRYGLNISRGTKVRGRAGNIGEVFGAKVDPDGRGWVYVNWGHDRLVRASMHDPKTLNFIQ